MKPTLKALQRVRESMERAVDKVRESHEVRCTAAIKRQLQDWEARFPRHQFEAMEGHGMLTFHVSPPVCGETYVADMGGKYYSRGAIQDIADEANDFLDIWNAMEWRVVSCPTDSIIKAR